MIIGDQNISLVSDALTRHVYALKRNRNSVINIHDGDIVAAHPCLHTGIQDYNNINYSAFLYYFKFLDRHKKIDIADLSRKIKTSEGRIKQTAGISSHNIGKILKREKLWWADCDYANNQIPIKSLLSETPNKMGINNFFKKVFDDLRSLIVTNEQRRRVHALEKVVFDNMNLPFLKFCNFTNNYLLSKIGIKKKYEIIQLTNLKKSIKPNFLSYFIENYHQSADIYGKIINKYNLPYKLLNTNVGEVPYYLIKEQSKTYYRYKIFFDGKGLVYFDKNKKIYNRIDEKDIIIGRSIFFLADLMINSYPQPILIAKGGSVYKKAIKDVCDAFLPGGVPMSKIKELQFNFLAALNDYNSLIHISGLYGNRIIETNKLREIIREKHDYAEKILSSIDKMTDHEILSYFNKIFLNNYNKINYKIINSKCKEKNIKYRQLKRELYKKSIINSLKNIYELENMLDYGYWNQRGSHIIWLYVIYGSDITKKIIDSNKYFLLNDYDEI
jgi:hypothetical protein